MHCLTPSLGLCRHSDPTSNGQDVAGKYFVHGLTHSMRLCRHSDSTSNGQDVAGKDFVHCSIHSLGLCRHSNSTSNGQDVAGKTGGIPSGADDSPGLLPAAVDLGLSLGEDRPSARKLLPRLFMTR